MAHLEYKLTLGDTSWTVDFGTLTVDDFIELKKVTGYSTVQLAVQFDNRDALALKGLVWFARRKAGEAIQWDAPAMNFVLADLRVTTLHDTTVEAEGGKKPVPTRARRAPRTQTSKTK